ncbi:hypothetical protein PR002_g655 [Phytophthora rubi]|uniref:Uncharacterized protein n=1 Tax=Phytophthora rubi TaxID=129364 RepID=A0A6A3NYG4_9STRA|nr:hypothetical protein PR002_g655 [Phytophthora rubi]
MGALLVPLAWCTVQQYDGLLQLTTRDSDVRRLRRRWEASETSVQALRTGARVLR